MCATAFLDTEKAFDNVLHKDLLYEVKSYLIERFFQIKINTPLSKYHPVQSGVP